MASESMYVRSIKMSDCMRKIILKVRITGLNVHRIRMFLSIKLIKLAAFIAGCGLEIETGKNDE